MATQFLVDVWSLPHAPQPHRAHAMFKLASHSSCSHQYIIRKKTHGLPTLTLIYLAACKTSIVYSSDLANGQVVLTANSNERTLAKGTDTEFQ